MPNSWHHHPTSLSLLQHRNTNMGLVDILRPQRDAAGLCQDIWTVAVLKGKSRNKQFTHQKTDKTGSEAHQGTVVPEQQTKEKNRSIGIKDATTPRCHNFSVVKELRGGVRKKKTFVQPVLHGCLFHWNPVERLLHRVSILQVKSSQPLTLSPLQSKPEDTQRSSQLVKGDDLWVASRGPDSDGVALLWHRQSGWKHKPSPGGNQH